MARGEVAPQLGVGERLGRGLGEAACAAAGGRRPAGRSARTAGRGRSRSPARQDLGQVHRAHGRTQPRHSPPPMCMRHDESPAVHDLGAGGQRRRSILSASIAPETARSSARTSRRSRSTGRRPAARRGRARALHAAAAAACRRRRASAASGRSGGRSRGAGSARRRPSTPSTSTSSSESSYVLAASARLRSASSSSPARSARPACWWRTDPTHDPLGATTDVARPRRRRRCRRTSGQRQVGVAGVDVHLPAAGLRLGEDHLVPEAFEHRHGGPPDRREHRVDEAGDEQADPHDVSVLRRARTVARGAWRG